ncbi:hypothetical protein BDQ17DRAFT_1412642 [Cyathus striatus]|nr:hypothetical protein BDQ17DRAFT_1412642 [Cyathus striatus]
MSYTRNRTSILSIPVELLQDIAQLASSRPVLRLVCRQFHDAITPQMFSSVRLSCPEESFNTFLEVLELLAAARRSPRIVGHKPKKPPASYEHSQSIKKWLPLAISNFKLATTVTWNITEGSSDDWSRDCVIAGIARMPSLSAFKLTIIRQDGISMQLDSLPPLQLFSICVTHIGEIHGIPELIAKSSSQLRQLELNCGTSCFNEYSIFLSSVLPIASALHITHLTMEVFNLKLQKTIVPHLRSLKSICLKKDSGLLVGRGRISSEGDLVGESAAPEDIWNLLKQENIFLQEITLDNPTESFICYFKSYTGLESLTISPRSSGVQSNALADDFYLHAICMHIDSLRKLDIAPSHDGKWGFGAHNKQALSKLVQLRYLSIPIIPDRYSMATNYNPGHPVCLIMQTASLLPRICHLNIRHPRQSMHPNTQQIDMHITYMGPLDPSKYIFTPSATCKKRSTLV